MFKPSKAKDAKFLKAHMQRTLREMCMKSLLSQYEWIQTDDANLGGY